MTSVNGGKPAWGGDPWLPGRLADIARVLQNKPSAVSGILAGLRKQGLLANSPVRQIAQTAIAARCGNSVEDGISVVEALSLPVEPQKLYGAAADLSGIQPLGAPDWMFLQGYGGFKSPLSLLKALPERHSFVDLFEQLLLSSHEPAAAGSIKKGADARPGTAVIAGRAAEVRIQHDGWLEIVRYVVPEDISCSHKDIAQFTGRTISLLAGLAEEHLVAQ